MTVQVDAIYLDGVLRPKQPLPLPNGVSVRVAVQTATAAAANPQAVVARLRAFRGMLRGLSREQMLVDRRVGLP
jgi:predicted DNA-binding antitoxin AbrB/MazE fold protein